MKARVDTSQYELSHGKKPRGIGSWAFMFGRKCRSGFGEVWWAKHPNSGVYTHILYGEAKRLAQVEAKRRGVTVVYVLS